MDENEEDLTTAILPADEVLEVDNQKVLLLRKIDLFMSLMLQTFTVQAGGSVRFICGTSLSESALKFYPNSSMTWELNDMPLIMDPSRTVYFKGNIEITTLRPSDTGVYTCGVSSHQGNSTENVTVGVYTLQITTETPTVIVLSQERLTLDCHSRTLGRLFESATRHWRFNGSYVTNPPSKHAHNQSEDFVEKVNKSMAGIWECEVRDDRSERVWKTAWYLVDVGDEASKASKWYKYMSQHVQAIIIAVAIFVAISCVLFMFSASKERETEDNADKSFNDERNGWQKLLGEQMEKGQIDVNDIDSALLKRRDDESSSDDEDEDSKESSDSGDSESASDDSSTKDTGSFSVSASETTTSKSKSGDDSKDDQDDDDSVSELEESKESEDKNMSETDDNVNNPIGNKSNASENWFRVHYGIHGDRLVKEAGINVNNKTSNNITYDLRTVGYGNEHSTQNLNLHKKSHEIRAMSRGISEHNPISQNKTNGEKTNVVYHESSHSRSKKPRHSKVTRVEALAWLQQHSKTMVPLNVASSWYKRHYNTHDRKRDHRDNTNPTEIDAHDDFKRTETPNYERNQGYTLSYCDLLETGGNVRNRPFSEIGQTTSSLFNEAKESMPSVLIHQPPPVAPNINGMPCSNHDQSQEDTDQYAARISSRDYRRLSVGIDRNIDRKSPITWQPLREDGEHDKENISYDTVTTENSNDNERFQQTMSSSSSPSSWTRYGFQSTSRRVTAGRIWKWLGGDSKYSSYGEPRQSRSKQYKYQSLPHDYC